MALSSPRDTSGILPNIDEEISTISGPFSILIAAASTSPTSNVRNAAPSRSMSIQTAQLQHTDQANRVETPPMISNGCPSYFAFLWGYAARRRMILRHKLNNPFYGITDFTYLRLLGWFLHTKRLLSTYLYIFHMRTLFSVLRFNVHTL